MEQNTDTLEFLYSGKKYTIESFMNEFGIDTEEDFLKIFETGVRKGTIKKVNLETTEKAQRDFDDIRRTIQEEEAADYVRYSEREEEEIRRAKRNENVPTYEKVKFDFTNIYDANKFANGIVKKGIPEDDVSINATHSVIVKNITESEFRLISFEYNAQNVAAATVRGVNSTVRKAAKLTDYTVNNIGIPVAKTALKGAGEVAKSLFTGLTRLGAAAITTVTESVAEAQEEIKSDPTIVKGTSDLNGAKDAAKAKFSNLTKMGSRGITIM